MDGKLLNKEQITDLKDIAGFAGATLQQMRAQKEAELKQIIALQAKIKNLNLDEEVKQDGPSK